jgi:hypothetical protein
MIPHWLGALILGMPPFLIGGVAHAECLFMVSKLDGKYW